MTNVKETTQKQSGWNKLLHCQNPKLSSFTYLGLWFLCLLVWTQDGMRTCNIWWVQRSVWQAADWFCWHWAIKIRRKLFYRYVLQSENASGKSYGALPVNYEREMERFIFTQASISHQGIRFHIIQYPLKGPEEMLRSHLTELGSARMIGTDQGLSWISKLHEIALFDVVLRFSTIFDTDSSPHDTHWGPSLSGERIFSDHFLLSQTSHHR